MIKLLLILHVFGFIAWFVGLLGTTAAQVSVRRAAGAEGRLAAWSAVKRLVPYEIVGMIVTPITGLAIAISVPGMFKMGFVHAKLLLVIIALIFNILLLLKRKDAQRQIAEDGPALEATLKRMAMFQGIATLMLPLAVLAVFLMSARH